MPVAAGQQLPSAHRRGRRRGRPPRQHLQDPVLLRPQSARLRDRGSADSPAAAAAAQQQPATAAGALTAPAHLVQPAAAATAAEPAAAAHPPVQLLQFAFRAARPLLPAHNLAVGRPAAVRWRQPWWQHRQTGRQQRRRKRPGKRCADCAQRTVEQRRRWRRRRRAYHGVGAGGGEPGTQRGPLQQAAQAPFQLPQSPTTKLVRYFWTLEQRGRKDGERNERKWCLSAKRDVGFSECGRL